jgi:L-alanine-DL-glutamate epimerase-like enolase superfamily enzyme
MDDEGTVAWGEGVPTHPYFEQETTANLTATLKSFSRLVIGQNPLELGDTIKAILGPAPKSRSALAAMDIALHDLFAKKLGVPLSHLFGRTKESMVTDYTIGIDSPENMASEAERKVAEGFKRIKIKVGTEIRDDMERVKKVEAALGQARLAVDANQAYSLGKASEFCRFLSKVENLEFLEQPLPRGRIKDTAALRKKTEVKIMLDEGVRDAGEAFAALKAEAADYVNVKLMKCGGIAEASKIASVCEAGGVKCMIGCYSDNSVGIAAAMHFALGHEVVQFADLDSDLMNTNVLARSGGAWIRDGLRGVGPSPGLGIEEIDQSMLTRELFVVREP